MTLVIKQQSLNSYEASNWVLHDSDTGTTYSLTLNKHHLCETPPPVEFSALFTQGDTVLHKATLSVNHEGDFILQAPENRLFHTTARGTEITISDAALAFATTAELFTLETMLEYVVDNRKQMVPGLTWNEVKALRYADMTRLCDVVGLAFIHPETRQGYYMRTQFPLGNAKRCQVKAMDAFPLQPATSPLPAYIVCEDQLEHFQTTLDQAMLLQR